MNKEFRKKEILTEMLRTLAVIKAGTEDNLSATYWKMRYGRDVSWLLKHLSETKKVAKDCAQNMEKVRQQLELAESLHGELMKDFYELKKYIDETAAGREKDG